MNIFGLSRCPHYSAIWQCDKHVVKMPLESAQMLCTTASTLEWVEDIPYRPCHHNHPCTLWVGQSIDNWWWLIEHGFSLCAEYTKRYGRRHKSEDVIEWASQLNPDLPELGLTKFALAMPTEYKCKSTVKSYRDYYLNEKRSFAKWAYSDPPPWWREA